jgi:gluconokinase
VGLILGLDVGTTAVKSVLFRPETTWQHHVSYEYPLLEPQRGYAVQRPDDVMSAVLAALSESAAVAASAGAEVLAVSVSSAMHGLIGLDDETRPLTPLVTWADSRAFEEARELRAGEAGPALSRLTGTPIHPMSPLTKLMWFARHEPLLTEQVRWWVGLKDYVLLYLTGTLMTESSSASGTGLFDLRRGTWAQEAAELAGVRVDQLPRLVSATSCWPLSREAAGRTALAVGTPVVAGAADGPLANVGAGALRPGVVGLSLGTSGAARMVVSAPTFDDAGSLFCYALTETTWVVGGAISNGGIVGGWAHQTLAPELGSVEELLDLAATAPAGSDGLLMLPYLLPERSPLWDAEIPGAYLGLRREHTRAHLVRAAVEGVARQLSTIVDQLETVAPVTTVRATGGALRSPLWRAVLASTLGRPLQVGDDAGGSARGAAVLGLLGLGLASDLESALALLPSAVTDQETVAPDPEAVAVYAGARGDLAALVGSLNPVSELFRQRQGTAT